MTVALELDADPPRLRRSDSFVVRFPQDEVGRHSVIEAGWLGADGSFESIQQWDGFSFQELHPGKNAALLVGHVPGGGYASAAVTVDDCGLRIEIAERGSRGSMAKQSVVECKQGERGASAP